MYKLLIVDDQKSSRDLMAYAATETGMYKVVGLLDNTEKALPFCRQNQLDLILMDIHTGSGENGIDTAREIKQLFPQIKVIIATFMVQAEYIEAAQNAGCEGFWYKDHSHKRLIELMDEVMAGQVVYPDTTPTVMVGMAKSSEFTKQELRVLQAKVNGYSNAETCQMLGITLSTLNYHIGNLKGKTGYDNLLQLTADVVMKRFIIADRNDEDFFD